MVSIMKIWKIILAVLTIVAGIVLFDEAGLVLNKVRLASAFGADVGSIVMYAGYIVSILYIIISILFLVYLNKKDNKGEKIIIVLSIIAFIFSFLGPKLFEDLQFLSFCAILCLITATVSFFNNKKSQSGLADLKQHCPYCGAVLNDDSLFCTKCGKELPKRIACPHCGASMNEGDAFCPNCGKSKNEESVEHSEEQESQQAPDVSENNTSKKYLPIIIGVIVLAILGAGWWSYKSSMEKTNVNLDSLFTVNLEEVKEDVEGNPTDKLSQFREKFTIKNILSLLDNPKNKSYAQKCGLEFILEDKDEYGGYQIIYGYDVEKEKKTDNWYDINALSEHSTYFKYECCESVGWMAYFKSKEDADCFLNEAKKHGFAKKDDCYTNGKWGMSMTEDEDWCCCQIYEYVEYEEYEETTENSNSNNGMSESNSQTGNIDWLQGHWMYRQGSYEAHLVIKENTVRQYSSLNSESTYYTFRVDGNTMYIKPIKNDGTDFFVTLDYQNHRIDYGDGNWMRKI